MRIAKSIQAKRKNLTIKITYNHKLQISRIGMSNYSLNKSLQVIENNTMHRKRKELPAKNSPIKTGTDNFLQGFTWQRVTRLLVNKLQGKV